MSNFAENSGSTAPANNYNYLVGAQAQLPEGFVLGNVQDTQAATGCTVIICPQGAVASVKVQGGAPATRETDLLSSENMVNQVHAVVLSGGSSFGLDACGGVVNYLEQHDIGMRFLGNVVPIVVGASLFDLLVGQSAIRPNAQMGYQAAQTAMEASLQAAAVVVGAVGNVGAGCGATVGKLMGPQFAMKSGLGAASVAVDELVVTSIMAVNAGGNVYDRQSDKWLAGALDPASLEQGAPQVLDTYTALNILRTANNQPAANSNTTIGCVLTNALLSKTQVAKVALMSHDGFARSIEPVHTSFDGDAMFCMAHGSVQASQDYVGILAAKATELAIHNAVLSAQGAYGLLANSDLSV